MAAPLRCPLCRLPLHATGRHVLGKDSADVHFVFQICSVCAGRLDRLPVAVQRRQLEIAAHRLEAQPERYDLLTFADEHTAALYFRLAVESG